MHGFRGIEIASVLLLISALGCSGNDAAKDRVVNVAADDAEMNAAIAKAQATLPEFWKKLDQPGADETDFALKVAITDSHGTEHFWATNLRKDGTRVFGTINNDPNTVQSVKLGQEVEIPADKISDWMYVRGEKMVGNFTLRPLLKTMPQEQAEQLRQMLAEP